MALAIGQDERQEEAAWRSRIRKTKSSRFLSPRTRRPSWPLPA